MQTLFNLKETLNQILPDSKIIEDTSCALQEEIETGGFDEEEPDKIPPLDVLMDVITKVYVLTNYDSALGNHYISQVAIGGIETQRSGIVTPKYFFASLYYTESLHLITVDFHDELR